jgi:hypothetical protein
VTDAEKRVQDRQAGDYAPPILTEPRRGPVPEWRPADDE